MQLSQMLYLALCVPLGLISGLLLGYIAREEIKDGRKWFILLQKIVFSLMIISYFYYSKSNIFFSIVVVLLLIYLLYKYEELIKTKYFHELFFILLALLLVIGKSENYSIILSSLIFIYCLPIGTILIDFKRKIKNLTTLLRLSSIFYITLILVYYVNLL